MNYFKLCLYIFGLISLFLVTGCAASDKSTISITKKYSPAELKEDLDFLIRTDEQVHPNLFVNTPKTFFDSLLSAAQNKLTDSITSLEFYKIVTPVVSCLKDGHTFLQFPYEFRQDYLKNGGRAIPFDIYIDENKMFVRRSYSLDSSLSGNSEILSINSVSSDSILKDLSNYSFGELETKRNYDIEAYFKPYLWANYNFTGPFEVQYISSKDKRKYSKSFAGITQKDFDSLFTPSTNTGNRYQYWTLEISGSDETAIIDINTFGNPDYLDRFKFFLDSSFSVIKRKNIQNLIIDIRDNGGGETELVEALIDYVANKPWTIFSKADFKLSSQAKSDLIPWYVRWVPIKTFINLFSFMYTSSNIDKAEYDSLDDKLLHVYMKPGKLKNIPLRFTGNTYLLINRGSYSASVILAAVMKDYGFATLIGEETGQPANPYGGNHFFLLPYTHLLASVSTGRSYRPSGIETNQGVIPDFEVKMNNNNKSQADSVLEFAKELIRKNTKTSLHQ